MSLLKCSTCGSDLPDGAILGKVGAILNTNCEVCGTNTGARITSARLRQRRPEPTQRQEKSQRRNYRAEPVIVEHRRPAFAASRYKIVESLFGISFMLNG